MLHRPLMTALTAEAGRPGRVASVRTTLTLRWACAVLGMEAAGLEDLLRSQIHAMGKKVWEQDGPPVPVALLMQVICTLAERNEADESVLDLAAMALVTRPQEFNAHSIASLTWAVGAARPNHKAILQQLAVLLSQPALLQELCARDVVRVTWALARLQTADRLLPSAVLHRTQERDVLKAMSGHDASVLAVALAAFAPCSQPAMEALRDEVVRRGLVEEFTARDVAAMAWAYTSVHGVQRAELFHQLKAASLRLGTSDIQLP
eukprot:GGOE01037915.1.p1 GENE.GGOE01037915.1~~GGOE01037915.1.p1  ORF type:complete len:263 (-),score=52.88 GGOE01037915.1:407-1195(-)